jgi:hypothetical protein
MATATASRLIRQWLRCAGAALTELVEVLAARVGAEEAEAA